MAAEVGLVAVNAALAQEGFRRPTARRRLRLALPALARLARSSVAPCRAALAPGAALGNPACEGEGNGRGRGSLRATFDVVGQGLLPIEAMIWPRW